MNRFSLRYKLLVLTIIVMGVFTLAADLPFTFKAGEVISAEQMNQNFAALNDGKQERVAGVCAAGSSVRTIQADGTVTCEVDDVGAGGGDAGVDAINGMTGAVTLQAGDNISIDDSTKGQLTISATGGGGGGTTYTAGDGLTLENNQFSVEFAGSGTATTVARSDHDHFGQSWSGTSDTSGLAVLNTNLSEGTSAILGRSGAGSGIDLDNQAAGVWGDSESGTGVVGTSSSSPGVSGYSSSSYGVYGISSSNIGVIGQSSSYIGVLGRSSSSTGVLGQSTDGLGVYGQSSSKTGVSGQSASGTGVGGSSTSGVGVIGHSFSNTGVVGESTSDIGVIGYTSGSDQSGVRGVTVGETSGYGVSGFSANGIGVYGQSTNDNGVFGRSDNGNAAYFVGGSGGTGNCYYDGGSGWNCTSDRNAKENFREVDTALVLEAVTNLPITTWNMKGDANQTPHMGPVAQDFYAAFNLGDSDTTINTADAQGVALAAIQGLYQLVQEQEKRIAELEAKLGLE